MKKIERHQRNHRKRERVGHHPIPLAAMKMRIKRKKRKREENPLKSSTSSGTNTYAQSALIKIHYKVW